MDKTNKMRKKEIARKVVLVILLIVCAFSLFKLGQIVYGYLSDRGSYSDIQKQVGALNLGEEIDFNKLEKINKDSMAWISNEGTVIDYPIVRGKDNDYYLARSIYKQSLGCGTLFADYRNKKDFSDFVTVIYGHHMKDGSMFASIEKYKKQSYYDKHKYMIIKTPDTNYKLMLFSGKVVPSDSKLYKFSFASDGEKERYIEKALKDSTFKSKVKVTAKDHIVVLSTCCYDFEDARYLVFGKLIEQ